MEKVCAGECIEKGLFMRAYIRKNLKKVIAVTVLFVAAVAFISSNELFAKKLPEASEISDISWYLESGRTYEYTGEEIQPTISSIHFVNAEEQTIVRNEGEFTILNYTDNIEIGNASIEVQLDGYNGSVTLTDAFYIHPGKVENVTLSYESEEYMALAWDAIDGADGYIVYRSADQGEAYEEVHTITDGAISNYEDRELAYNTTYLYKVRAYSFMDEQRVCGGLSDAVEQTTILATPVITSAEMESFDSIQIRWEAVDGAAGYQVYRSDAKNGEYECIKEFADGKQTSYIDTARECGIAYYYYVKAKQTINDEDTWGNASDIVSAKTTPNYVGISGSVSNEDTQVTLKWKQSQGAQGYEIYRSTGYSSDYKLVKKVDQNTTTWTDTGLDKNTEYSYRIRPYAVVNETTITGSYSNVYTKEVVVVSDYTQTGSGNLSGVTQYTGTRYRAGGYTPSGWDCSGFTKWALQEYYGVSIPKPAVSQGNGGASVSVGDRSQWQPGDILAYSDGSGVSHVALYLGNGQLMHALNEKYGTVIQGVDYYENWDSGNRLVAVKRYH